MSQIWGTVWIFKFMKLVGHQSQLKVIFSKAHCVIRKLSKIKDKKRVLKASRGKKVVLTRELL